MIDADRIDLPVRDQLCEQLMRRLEDLLAFHAKPDQRVDVEEPPVVDLMRGGSPVGEPVRLRLEQFVQGIEGCWLPGRPVQRLDRRVYRLTHRALLTDQAR